MDGLGFLGNDAILLLCVFLQPLRHDFEFPYDLLVVLELELV